MRMLERLADGLWRPWTLGLFLLVGLWCSARSGFFQVFGVKTWLKGCLGSLRQAKKGQKGRGLTQLQALSTALASTIGTGSIAGVATAIFFGGPGAVFWMWVSAAVGMMTGFVEKAMAIRYRRQTAAGWEGGPMEYLSRGLGWPGAAKWFSLWCVGASLTGGAMVQSNSISTAFHAVLGWNTLAVGSVVAVAAGAVMLGGIGRVGQVSEKLVPVMGGLFLLTGTAVIAAHREMIWPALRQIVTCALTPGAALGGASGYTVSAAVRYGVARGVFTNEAGMGSSAMAHAAADTDSPLREGFWGIFEVFFATVLICSVTALAILTSGVYDPAGALAAAAEGTVTADMTGSALSAAAFSTVFGRWGGVIVAVCLLLFAFTSLLGWSYYGERGLDYLTGERRLRRPFQLIFLAAAVLGSVGDVSRVWALSDVCNALMAWPNLLGLAALAGEAAKLLEKPKKGSADQG